MLKYFVCLHSVASFRFVCHTDLAECKQSRPRDLVESKQSHPSDLVECKQSHPSDLVECKTVSWQWFEVSIVHCRVGREWWMDPSPVQVLPAVFAGNSADRRYAQVSSVCRWAGERSCAVSWGGGGGMGFSVAMLGCSSPLGHALPVQSNLPWGNMPATCSTWPLFRTPEQ